MSKRAVDLIFSTTYTLTDLRMILRETAPRTNWMSGGRR